MDRSVIMSIMKTTAIILAGGKGSRFKGKEPKQFLKIGTRTMLDMCLQPFQKNKGVQEIILVCPKEHLAQAKKIAGHYSKVAVVVAGGKTRQGSSANGVAAAGEAGQILIHDAARALVPNDVIDRVLKALSKNAAVMPVLPAEDTTVRVDDKGNVTAVLDRDKLRRVQTPQGFRADIIRIAHRLAQDEGFADAPDDCSLILRYGLAPIASVTGDAQNIKITYPSDLEIASALI